MGEEKAGQQPSRRASSEVRQAEIQSVSELGRFPIPVAAPTVRPPAIPNTSTTPEDAGPITSWNTRKLGLRVGADAVSAGAAGVLVAPIITVIDKGIIENASGRRSLGESLKGSFAEMVRKPGRFFGGRPFGLIFVRYIFSSLQIAGFHLANPRARCYTLEPTSPPTA